MRISSVSSSVVGRTYSSHQAGASSANKTQETNLAQRVYTEALHKGLNEGELEEEQDLSSVNQKTQTFDAFANLDSMFEMAADEFDMGRNAAKFINGISSSPIAINQASLKQGGMPMELAEDYQVDILSTDNLEDYQERSLFFREEIGVNVIDLSVFQPEVVRPKGIIENLFSFIADIFNPKDSVNSSSQSHSIA